MTVHLPAVVHALRRLLALRALLPSCAFWPLAPLGHCIPHASAALEHVRTMNVLELHPK